jgi:hypothetical protein
MALSCDVLSSAPVHLVVGERIRYDVGTSDTMKLDAVVLCTGSPRRREEP